jgi:tRNA threonylcarbamoyl adenosine modification protein YeaZ
MDVLGVETSTAANSAAIINENRTIAEITINSGQTHSKLLLKNIDSLLNDTGLKLKDIDLFVISKGPGSFTGLRVGFSIIKGFAFVLKKKVISVNSLDAFALKIGGNSSYVESGIWSGSGMNRIICPVIDAKKNEVFYSFYEETDGGLIKLMEENAGTPEILAEQLNKYKYSSVIFAGDGYMKYKDKLLSLTAGASISSFMNMYPSAGAAFLGMQKNAKGIEEELKQIQPFYLKKTEAEIKHEHNTKDGSKRY